MTLMNYSFTEDNDQVFITEVHRVTAAGAAATTMAANALTAVGVSIGATKYSSKVKCFSRGVQHVHAQTWDVSLSYRTEQFDDLIQNAASNTVIDKGFSGAVENVLRNRHPTSGATYALGAATSGYIKNIQQAEPRLEAWWEKVHDAYPQSAATSLLGAVNSVTWNGYAANLWLCADINTRTIRTEGGQRYLTRYSFVFKPEGWVLPYRELVWDGRTLSSIAAVTKVTGQFVGYRSHAFATYGFTF